MRAEFEQVHHQRDDREIRTKAGETYNYEDIDEFRDLRLRLLSQQVGTDRCYTVKVEVRDGLDDDRVEVEGRGRRRQASR